MLAVTGQCLSFCSPLKDENRDLAIHVSVLTKVELASSIPQKERALGPTPQGAAWHRRAMLACSLQRSCWVGGLAACRPGCLHRSLATTCGCPLSSAPKPLIWYLPCLHKQSFVVYQKHRPPHCRDLLTVCIDTKWARKHRAVLMGLHPSLLFIQQRKSAGKVLQCMCSSGYAQIMASLPLEEGHAGRHIG